MEDKTLTQGEKIIGGLSYIFFFLPLINGNQKAFNRFHANQGLLLFILTIIINALNIGISYFQYVDSVFVVFSFGLLLYLFLLGVNSAARGEKREFPRIGKIKIIKEIKSKTQRNKKKK